MGSEIASNVEVAAQKKAEMLSNLDEYVSFKTQSAASSSEEYLLQITTLAHAATRRHSPNMQSLSHEMPMRWNR